MKTLSIDVQRSDLLMPLPVSQGLPPGEHDFFGRQVVCAEGRRGSDIFKPNARSV